VVFSTV